MEKLVTAIPLKNWHAVTCHLFVLSLHFRETTSTWSLFLCSSGPTLYNHRHSPASYSLFSWHIKAALIHAYQHFVVPGRRLLSFSQTARNLWSQTMPFTRVGNVTSYQGRKSSCTRQWRWFDSIVFLLRFKHHFCQIPAIIDRIALASVLELKSYWIFIKLIVCSSRFS